MNNDVKMSLVYLTSLPSRPSEDPHRVQAKVSSRLRYHIRPQCAAGSDHPSWLNWCLRLISKAFSCTFHRELPQFAPQYEVQFRQCHHLSKIHYKSLKGPKTLLIFQLPYLWCEPLLRVLKAFQPRRVCPLQPLNVRPCNYPEIIKISAGKLIRTIIHYISDGIDIFSFGE